MYLQIRKLRHREVKLLEITQLVRAGAGGPPGRLSAAHPRASSKVLCPGPSPFPAAQGLLPVASGGSYLTLAGTATSVVRSPTPLPYSKFLKVQRASLTPFWPLQLPLGTEKRLQQVPLG